MLDSDEDYEDQGDYGHDELDESQDLVGYRKDELTRLGFSEDQIRQLYSMPQQNFLKMAIDEIIDQYDEYKDCSFSNDDLVEIACNNGTVALVAACENFTDLSAIGLTVDNIVDIASSKGGPEKLYKLANQNGKITSNNLQAVIDAVLLGPSKWERALEVVLSSNTSNITLQPVPSLSHNIDLHTVSAASAATGAAVSASSASSSSAQININEQELNRTMGALRLEEQEKTSGQQL